MQPHKVLGDGLHDKARECEAEVGDHRDEDEPNCDLLQAQEQNISELALGKLPAIVQCPAPALEKRTCIRGLEEHTRAIKCPGNKTINQPKYAQ